MDAGVAGRFDVGALRAGPVLVVADRHEDFVVGDLRAAAVGVDTGEVTDVVAVHLEPAQHRIFGVEQPALRRANPRVERAVVAHLRGTAAAAVDRRVRNRTAAVQARTAVAVVGLPRGVGGLKEQLRVARIVTDDEDDVAGRGRRNAAVDARQLREKHARRLTGRVPRGGHAPCAAVDETGRRVGRTRRLHLRLLEQHGRRRDLPCARVAVVAQAINVDSVIDRVGVDLEVDRLPDVDAEPAGKTLNRRIGPAGEVPIVVTSKTVFGDDRVRRTPAAASLGQHGDASRAATGEDERGRDRKTQSNR